MIKRIKHGILLFLFCLWCTSCDGYSRATANRIYAQDEDNRIRLAGAVLLQETELHAPSKEWVLPHLKWELEKALQGYNKNTKAQRDYLTRIKIILQAIDQYH